MSSGGQAYVTLATNDSYGLGALVLGHSLRNSGTTRKLVILITPEVSNSMRNQLSKVFDSLEMVDVMDSQDSANLALLARPELGVTLTKLHAWNLNYEKAVFMDADCLVLSNVDELFEREELSAVPDVGWPDCFNTGVFVFRPNPTTYSNLIKFAQEHGSFDGGDQGLLNSYFSDWATKDIQTHLSFIYNMVATAIYSYAPAFKQYGSRVKIVHFLGSTKPWHHTSVAAGSFSPALGNFLTQWWNIFNQQVRGSLEPGLVGLAARIGEMNLGSSQQSFHSHVHASGGAASQRRDWEAGNIDYMGSDRFENIQKRIQQSIQTSQSTQSVRQPSPPHEMSTIDKAKEAVVGVAHAAAAAKDSVVSAVGSAVESGLNIATGAAAAVAEKIDHLVHPQAPTGARLQSEATRPSPPPGATEAKRPTPPK